ncbi:C69 family dipeptidase [Fructilactobacillus cliffordii]|uniref:C69 family dipeptidase n=1 Tax=Fructilactobacillus cliffordii TaxID=2940299 RepID=UPI0020929F98|nr:C69 family dipeptidase [Fructilactobacillus cliffordii]USS86677.1 C69 family dipeptidase [Fructilactobacillus cliffordii]
MTEPNYSACTSMLVGKNATVDGSTLIGRNEDAKAAWPKRFVVHEHQVATDPVVFQSTANGFQLELPAEAAKYTATPEWTDSEGLFEEEGINEHGVAMSATESTYANDSVLGCDPLVKDGLGEEAMVTVVLPYVKSAREGVQRLGEIVSTKGASETNGILFSDAQEVWYFEIGSGHQWVAQRIPDDCYAVVANQMAIEKVDFNDQVNFQWSQGLEKFVTDNHLNPDRHGFNFRHIFGTRTQMDTYYNTPRVWYGQRMFNPEIEQEPTSQDLPFLRKSSRRLSATDVQMLLSSHYQGTEFDPVGTGSEFDKHRFRPISFAKTQESHVLQLQADLPVEIGGIHWLSMGVGAESTFVPFFAGISETPAAYQYPVGHDYDPQSAYWNFKLVGILTDAHYHRFIDQVNDVQAELRQSYRQIINQAQSQVANSNDLVALANQASNQAAKLALSRFQALSSQLITDSADLSPLNYHQDLNL